MRPQHLFHPNHIVPFSKLISALMEMCRHLKSLFFMEMNAGRIGPRDAGIEIEKSLFFQRFFQCVIQRWPTPVPRWSHFT